MRDNATCVIVQTCEHLNHSRTYAGRNHKHIPNDAINLYHAATLDLAQWEIIWKQKGWSDDKITSIKNQIHQRNRAFFNSKGLQYEP